ncbi:MAG: hypothetical protein WC998_09220 [Candidatus Paceibacterota bacterium]
MVKTKETCKDCEVMKIITRLQWNLQKANNTEAIKEALDAAIAGKDYFNFGE